MIESAQYIGLAIGIGMCLSLFLTETLGVTAGGVIVPGYIALFLHEPIQIIVTFSISLLVLFILRILSNFMFIYGKRRLVLSLLLGFFFGYLSKIYFDFEILNAFINSDSEIIPCPYHNALFLTHSGIDSAFATFADNEINKIENTII